MFGLETCWFLENGSDVYFKIDIFLFLFGSSGPYCSKCLEYVLTMVKYNGI